MENQIWNLFTELRKELLESQKIRSQIIGFKVTFVAAVVGILAKNIDRIDNILFLIPAFAAFAFDY